jgi:hypothetical protein
MHRQEEASDPCNPHTALYGHLAAIGGISTSAIIQTITPMSAAKASPTKAQEV